MPLEVRGHLDLPEEPDDPPAVELLIQDGKAIGEVEAVVQNFIAPDPLAGLVVPDRPVAASPGPPAQEIAFLPRGDAFRPAATARKSVAEGKCGAARVDLGGRRYSQ